MKKRILSRLGLITATVAMLTVALTGMSGCSSATEINVSGSSSVSPLMQKLAAEYEKTHDVTIIVNTSDSSTGITEAKEGRNDFGMASKKVNEDDLTTVQIATDGVAVIINHLSTISDVSVNDIYSLYANGTPIQTTIVAAISREAGSGTYDAFGDLIQNEQGEKLKNISSFASCVSVQNSTGNVKSAIASNDVANTIGYISMGSVDSSIKCLKVNGVEATTANVKEGSYALLRPFNIVYNTSKGLSAEAKGFLDFILSSAGQAIVVESGYVDVL